MQLPRRNLLVRLLLPPSLLFLVVSVYVPTRFEAPPDAERLTVRGEAAQDSLSVPGRVLVWNIYKGNRSGFSDEMQALAEGCGLLLLQEYHANEQVHRVMDEPASHAFCIATSFLYRSDASATGVTTGCVAPVLSSECFITSNTEPVTRTPKAALACTYSLTGTDETLLVVNVHAINVVGLRAFQNQLEQFRDVLQAHAGPILFAGDFNTNTESKQAFLREFATEFELQEMTFADDSRTTSPLLGLPIDYVFTRGLATSQHRVVGSSDASDHMALSFQIDAVL